MRATPAASLRAREARRRPLLGLRGRPGRAALGVLRLPLGAYERGWGPVLDGTFARVVHVGRRTGLVRATVAMVIEQDVRSHEVVVCSAWGPQSDWVLNLRAAPALRLDVGSETFVPAHRFLDDAEACEVAKRFRASHPHRLRLMGGVLGWGDLRSDEAIAAFVRTHPFIAFRPAIPTQRA